MRRRDRSGWFLLGSLWGVLCLSCPGPQSSCSDDSECAADASCNREVGVCVTCDIGACAGHQQCLKGSCGARYQSITITRPSGGLASPNAPLQARLDLAPGATRDDPPSLTYVVTDAAGKTVVTGTMARVGEGLYEAAWTPTGSASFNLVVRYDAAGLTGGPVQFSIDAQPPTVELVVPTPVRRDGSDPSKANEQDPAALFATAWRRNEMVNISIKASEPLDLGGSTVVLTEDGATAPLVAARTLSLANGCGAPFCATVAFDLAEPPMRSFRTTWNLRLSAIDLAGNAAQAMAPLRVTRHKWRFGVANDIIQTTPVIGSGGNLFFATSSGGTSIYTLTPNGLPVWAAPVVTGAIRGGMTVQKIGATEWLFYAAVQAGNNVQILARNAANGSAAAGDCSQPGQDADGAGAIVLAGGVPSFAAVVRSGGAGTLVSYRPDQADPSVRCVTSGVPRGIDFPGNIAADGADTFFGDDLGDLQSYNLAGGWTIRSGWPKNSIFARSLVLSAADVTGAIGQGLSRGRAFAVTKATGVVGAAFPSVAGFLPEGWASSLGPNDQLLFSNETPTWTLVGVRQGTATKSTNALPNFQAAPVFGQGGLIYVADETGILSAVDVNLDVLWQAAVANQFQASPTIDCARDGNGAPIPGRPGVLYTASTTGTVDAIIVDSKGLDTTAPWPKYQHDPRNTGNFSTALAEFACP